MVYTQAPRLDEISFVGEEFVSHCRLLAREVLSEECIDLVSLILARDVLMPTPGRLVNKELPPSSAPPNTSQQSQVSTSPASYLQTLERTEDVTGSSKTLCATS